MKNDFFKYILLSSGSKQNRTELETETLPYTFNSNGHRLRNYRIYGNTVNGESVGDIVTEGEHSGEYLLPVTVSGKNLLKNTVTSQTINGVTFTVHSDKSVTANGTATDMAALHIPIVLEAGNYILSGCPMGGNANSYRLDTMRDAAPWGVVGGADYGSGAVSQFEERMSLVVRVRIANGYTCDNLTFYPMIRPAAITDDTYEPYHEPITTNIYLPEPLRKIGDDAEHIDFREQKQYFADGTSENISLPAIPTIDGTNIITVDTETQPSKIWIQGNISEIETVSAETVQANIQNLQPLSLDVMPIDRSEFQINDISEVPVEDENPVEEIPEAENFETSGDEENAE